MDIYNRRLKERVDRRKFVIENNLMELYVSLLALAGCILTVPLEQEAKDREGEENRNSRRKGTEKEYAEIYAGTQQTTTRAIH